MIEIRGNMNIFSYKFELGIDRKGICQIVTSPNGRYLAYSPTPRVRKKLPGTTPNALDYAFTNRG
jgi:hypothetical protein